MCSEDHTTSIPIEPPVVESQVNVVPVDPVDPVEESISAAVQPEANGGESQKLDVPLGAEVQNGASITSITEDSAIVELTSQETADAPTPQENVEESTEVQDADELTAGELRENSVNQSSEAADGIELTIAEPLVQAQDDDFLGNLLKVADTKEEEIGNDSSSERDSSSDDSDDSDDSDTIQGIAGSADQLDDAQGDEEDGPDEPIKSKNEITDEPAEQLPGDFKIDDTEPIQHIGEIVGFVEKSIVVKSVTSAEFRYLREGSVLCFEDRTPIGYLFEIFGPVSKPMYRIKFNDDETLQIFKDKKNEKVFYVVPKSHFAYTDAIKSVKGTDASNWNDEELPVEEQEFSDDEKEMESKKSRKKKRGKKDKDDDGQQKDAPEKKKPNNWQRPRPTQQTQPMQPMQPSATNKYHPQQPSFSTGYKPRSEREQNQNPQPVPYPGIPAPGMFQPPPQMIYLPSGFPPMPVMPTMPTPPQGQMTPEQFQQFQAFVQTQMMQQFMNQMGQNQNASQGSHDT